MNLYKVVVKQVHEYVTYVEAEVEENAEAVALTKVNEGEHSEKNVWDQSVEVELDTENI